MDCETFPRAAGPRISSLRVRRARRFVALALVVAGASGAAPTTQKPKPPPGSIPGLGGPTAAVALDGGRTLLVGFEGRFGRGGGMTLYRRGAAGYAAAGTVRTMSPVEGVAVSPDGKTAVATTRFGLAAVAVDAVTTAHPKVTEVRVGEAPDANQIVFGRDGTVAYFTIQRYAQLGVVAVSPATAGAAPGLTVTARLGLDRSPGGIALSPDGTTLYVTSEADTVDPAAVALANDPRLGRAKCAANQAPHGVLSVVDAAKAARGADDAVVARVAAGCAPTRVALSPDGATAWVSVRGEDRVVAFDTAKLRDDGAHAFVAEAAVEAVPVGLAVSVDGGTLLVANSHRSRDADDMRAADLTVIDPRAALAGKPAVREALPTGALAREVIAAPDGGFFVTDYLARAVDVVRPQALHIHG